MATQASSVSGKLVASGVPPTQGRSFVRLGVFAVVGLFIVGTILSGFFTVDQSERGVVLRNGAYARTAEPGLNFKLPWVESERKVSVQTTTLHYDKVNSYSADQQPADLVLSATFHIDPARVSDLYAEFGTTENAVSRAISPHIYQEVKVVFGQYTAVKAIQDRAKLNADALEAMRVALKPYPMIVLEGLQVEDIQFSGQYIQSVEQRMQAEVEVQKVQQNAEREKVQAQIKVIQAQGAADSVVAQAKADADATRLRGDAEASAIRAKGEALRNSPDLVAYTQATRWNGVLPATILSSGTIPMLQLPPSPTQATEK
jgi:regulator of protease activity HflC (stomatin/prohibitin superfamily)